MAAETGGFWSGIGSSLSGYGNSAMNYLSDGKNLAGLGQLIGGAGQAYSGYKQSKAAEAMLDLQKDSYWDEKKRRGKTQVALDDAFNTAAPLVPPAALKLV